RPHPKVVIHACGNRAVGLLADRAALVVADAPRDLHLAELPLAHELDRLPDVAERAGIIPHLAELVVLPARLDELAALEEVVAERLLDIDVLPRLDAPDGRQAVPVVGRGDRDGV